MIYIHIHKHIHNQHTNAYSEHKNILTTYTNKTNQTTEINHVYVYHTKKNLFTIHIEYKHTYIHPYDQAKRRYLRIGRASGRGHPAACSTTLVPNQHPSPHIIPTIISQKQTFLPYLITLK